MRGILRTLKEKVDPSHTALVVVDMQNDLCSPEGSFARMGLDVSAISAMVPNLTALIKGAKEAGVLTIYTRVIDTYMPAISPAYYEANLDFYEANSGATDDDNDAGDVPWISPEWGEAFFESIAPAPDDVEIVKHRFGAFANTKLDQILRSKGIKTLVIGGVITDVCVESTARAALDHDYYVVVPDDCTATLSEERKRASLNAIGTFIGTVTPSEEIVAIWQGRA